MENINELLTEALTPYHVDVVDVGGPLECRVILRDSTGALVLDRRFSRRQFADTRALTDVVDGLHRDLMVVEGRLQPCMLAAMAASVQAPVAGAVMS
ncbi:MULTISPECIES: DUF3509 domain-containing protein [Pseudomonas]|uniref:DUF3509 domain-containing protein n=1 Tax=Pseudomonas eucalypticola TaxID=2599595 RepID=A0A7D5HEH2_9PSED|nr:MULTISPECIES: DUF3509 domain-containing protein [Pseudomonas]QKZ03366.1 DUF3509 domain-containing protein [Pseudomonas eucalypticola]